MNEIFDMDVLVVGSRFPSCRLSSHDLQAQLGGVLPDVMPMQVICSVKCL
jgi:hypothetical protein